MTLRSIILKYSEKDKLKLISKNHGITIRDLLINEAELILNKDIEISKSEPIPKYLRVSYSINIEDTLKQQIDSFCKRQSVRIKDFWVKCVSNILNNYNDFLDENGIWAESIYPDSGAFTLISHCGLLTTIDIYEMKIKEKSKNRLYYIELATIYHDLYDFKEEKRIYKLANDNIDEYDGNIVRGLENVEHYLKNGTWLYDSLTDDITKPENHRNTYQGKALLKEGNKKEGIELLETAIENKTLINTAYYTLYQTYKKDKQYDDAIRICDEAIENLGFFSKERLNRWTEIKNKTLIIKEKNK